MARRRPSPGFLFRITYRREWWSQPSHRTFLSEAAARRFVGNYSAPPGSVENVGAWHHG